MFTGIVEGTGKVEEIRRRPVSRRITVSTALDLDDLAIGGSIAVNGVCLTVVEISRARFSADLGHETLARTTFGELRLGARVHLERPLRLSDRLGGHLVTGHVDAVGRVAARTERGDGVGLEIEAPPDVIRALVPKGSVAIDGVSLTVNRVRGSRFSVALIPHTLAVTELGARAVGAAVNLEADLVAKHIDRLVTAHLGALPVRGVRVELGAARPRKDRRIRIPQRQPW